MNTEILSLCENRSLSVNDIDTDFKAEVIAAGLIEKGLDPEQVCILPMGSAARGYSKDIAYARTASFYRRHMEYLSIWVNRQGLYDLLPEGIFHRINGVPFQKSKAETLEDIKKLRMEEESARAFFRPLEVTAGNALVNAQLYERRLDKKHTNRSFMDIFSRFWPVLKLLPLSKAVLLLEIMSVLPDIVHRLEYSSQIMSAILDVPVSIRLGERSHFPIQEDMMPPLGKMKLGVNSVIGNFFENGYHDINISLGETAIENILFYNKDENGKKIISFLIQTLLPADKEVRIKYIPLHGTGQFILSPEGGKKAYLGINTYIYSKKK